VGALTTAQGAPGIKMEGGGRGEGGRGREERGEEEGRH
jgi:hypothetical protein